MATREEIGLALQKAHDAGDIEVAKLLAKAYSETPETTQPTITDEGNPIINALRGFSARGNQAMNALNPLASPEDDARIAGEQEWVKQNSGAGVGSTLADMAITAPAGGIGGAIPRILATGYAEGLTHNGNFQDKMEEMAAGSLGAGVGEGAAKVIGFLAQPFKKAAGSAIDTVTDGLRNKARDIGINLNAAQETGNRTLQAVDKQLSVLPSSSEFQAAQKEGQRLAWQEALFKQGGENANMATPDVMGGMKSRISGVYDDVAGRNSLMVDPQFKADLSDIEKTLMERIPVNQKNIVASYLRDFGTAPEGAAIAGKQYQDIRSMLDKQSKAFRNSDPATAEALKRIRGSADSAMERSLIGQNSNALPSKTGADDLEAWRKANKDWSVMRTIETAVDPETATIRPNILLNKMRQRDPNRVIYGAGDQEFTDIAKVGKAFIPDKAPDSGTAINSAIVKALTGGSVLGGTAGADYAISRDPAEAAGVGAASLAASILGPKAAARAMWKDGGYLSKGLADLTKEVTPGLTRQRIIAEILRNAGNQAAQD
ncbi:MAG: hypothetical protein M0R47_16655 [Methylobacter sp.]|uniref:hypothetical protein n=1 Tax=Methylobacter sp. TaxID=2051955 RepID=UPI0025DACD2C|nr:hypothetical protein [Methylobacter sp.]MCK9622153.1 hypothetical protein [Methylobacter sp.]